MRIHKNCLKFEENSKGRAIHFFRVGGVEAPPPQFTPMNPHTSAMGFQARASIVPLFGNPAGVWDLPNALSGSSNRVQGAPNGGSPSSHLYGLDTTIPPRKFHSPPSTLHFKPTIGIFKDVDIQCIIFKNLVIGRFYRIVLCLPIAYIEELLTILNDLIHIYF